MGAALCDLWRRISGQHVKGHWWYCRVCEREWAIPRYRVSNPVFNTDPEKGALGRLPLAQAPDKRRLGRHGNARSATAARKRPRPRRVAQRAGRPAGGRLARGGQQPGRRHGGRLSHARRTEKRAGSLCTCARRPHGRGSRWYPPSASCARAWYYHHPEWADFHLLRWEPYGPAREHRRYRLANGRRRLYRWVAFPDGRHTPYLAPCAYGHIPTGAALGAAASNAAYRKANGVCPASIPVAEPPMTTLEEAQEAAARLQRLQAAAGLTEREERIVHLSLNGYQFAEIAAELEAHPASISRSWHNALRKLQEAEARQSQELTQQEAA
jgi:DNA-binding CsgD family transcriptional regulator